jgi:hypothetical protein
VSPDGNRNWYVFFPGIAGRKSNLVRFSLPQINIYSVCLTAI